MYFLCVLTDVNHMYLSLMYYKEYFHCCKNILGSAYAFFSTQTPGNQYSFHCFHSFAFSRMSDGITYSIASWDWLLSFNNMHLTLPLVFGGLKSHLVLALNTIPLSGSTITYLFIHLLNDILVVSKFWQSIIKLL